MAIKKLVTARQSDIIEVMKDCAWQREEKDFKVVWKTTKFRYYKNQQILFRIIHPATCKIVAKCIVNPKLKQSVSGRLKEVKGILSVVPSSDQFILTSLGY